MSLELATHTERTWLKRLKAAFSMAYGKQRRLVTDTKILVSLALEHVAGAQNLICGTLIQATDGGLNHFPAQTSQAESFFVHAAARQALFRLKKLTSDDMGLAGGLRSALGHPIDLADLTNGEATRIVRKLFGDDRPPK
jgi:hypothetical protein